MFLVESGFAQQTDVARAFSRSVRTMRRYQGRYARAGWQRSVARKVASRSTAYLGKRLRSIEMMKSQGMSNRAIAHQLGVSEKAIRKLVGPSKPAESAQLAFAGIPTVAEKPPPTRVPVAPSAGDEADGDTSAEEVAQGTAIRSQRLRTTMSRCR